MADRLKGITVEIGGDTTNLQGALQEVNNKGRQLQRELGDVQRLLRFDPENTDLLAQRQEILSQSIQNTTRRLDQLRGAQEQVQEQFRRGDIGADQFRAFQREIIQTEQRLEHFEREAQGTARDVRGAFRGLGGGIASGIAGAVAGAGIGAIIQKSLETSSKDTQIEISFAVPEEGKQAVKDALTAVENYGVDSEAALEGVRRQWAMNLDQTKEQNAAVVESAAIITKSFSEVDFTELIQEANEMATAFGISQEDALGMTNTLLKMGFPPDQLDIITEYGSQLAQAGYNAAEIQGIMASAASTDPWNIDVLLDGVKEGRINMAAFGETVDKSMSDLIEGTNISANQLDAWGDAVAAGGAEGKTAMEDVTKAVMAIEDPAKRNAVGVKVFGTLWEENGSKIADTILNANAHMGDMKANTDALAKSGEAIKADPMVRLNTAMAELQKTLTPLLATVAEWVAKVADWVAKNPELSAGIAAVVIGIGLLIAAGMALAPVISLLSAAAISLQIGMLPLIGIILGIIVGIGLLVAGIMWLVKNWDMVIAKTKEFIDKTNQWFEGWKEGVKKRFAESVQSAKDMVAKINQAFENWKNGVRERFNKAIQDVKNLWNGLVGWFQGIDLKSIARNIFQGFINGISEMKDKVFRKARELADGVGKTIKNALKIGSPSKITTELGEFTGEGLIVGLENSMSQLKSMSNKMAAAAIPDIELNNSRQVAAGKSLNVTINSPKALDVREANREFGLALNRMSLMW